ncbi:MAG: DUF1289 domain-containing protein [Pseudomonadota bacterium]
MATAMSTSDADLHESPCKKICKLSEQLQDSAQVCLGCGRTLTEIAEWSKLDLASRKKVSTLAASRLTNIQFE